jgi:site-specific DNA-methyltransferase (adenine-specific)
MEINKIYLGNATTLLTEKNFVDLIITSPPYETLRKYDNNIEFNFEKMADKLTYVLKDGGILVWIVNDKVEKGSESLVSFKQAIYFKEKCNLRLHDTMIYAKTNPIPMNHNRYEQIFEYMFVFSKGKPKTFKPLREELTHNYTVKNDKHHERNYKRGNKIRGHKKDKIRGNIWFYNIGFNSSTKDKEAFQHPAIFPEQLVEDHVLSWSNPGDLVLDPMCGSGTTCKIAKKLDRNYIGIDISPFYVDIARRRISKI